MGASRVRLPAAVGDSYEVYVNGVRQEPGVDFSRERHSLVFDRALRKDRVSGWRWFLGAWGVGTYRQDDTVDISYVVGGERRLAHRVDVTLIGDD